MQAAAKYGVFDIVCTPAAIAIGRNRERIWPVQTISQPSHGESGNLAGIFTEGIRD